MHVVYNSGACLDFAFTTLPSPSTFQQNSLFALIATMPIGYNSGSKVWVGLPLVRRARQPESCATPPRAPMLQPCPRLTLLRLVWAVRKSSWILGMPCSWRVSSKGSRSFGSLVCPTIDISLIPCRNSYIMRVSPRVRPGMRTSEFPTNAIVK